MFRKFIILTALIGFSAGCQDDQQADTPSLTNAELLQLMQGVLFEVRIPDDIHTDQFAGLATRNSDGTIDTMGSSNGWTPGELVKVVCFSPDKNTFRYAWFRTGGEGSGSTTNFPITQNISPNPKRTELAVDERLVRYSRDNPIVVAGDLQDDDFDVVFHVQKKKDNKTEMATPRKPSD